jgi:hypothetical protein
MKRIARVAILLYLIPLMYVSIRLYDELSLVGFPDGYISDFDRATELPFSILSWINIAFALYFLYLGIFSDSKGLGKKTVVTIIIHILFFVFAYKAIVYYYKIYLGLSIFGKEV